MRLWNFLPFGYEICLQNTVDDCKNANSVLSQVYYPRKYIGILFYGKYVLDILFCPKICYRFWLSISDFIKIEDHAVQWIPLFL